MRQVRGYTLVSGPRDGQRIMLDNAYMSLAVLKPQVMPFAWDCDVADSIPAHDIIEYTPVRGVPGVLAPRGTAPELVIDMLVAKYA